MLSNRFNLEFLEKMHLRPLLLSYVTDIVTINDFKVQ